MRERSCWSPFRALEIQVWVISLVVEETVVMHFRRFALFVAHITVWREGELFLMSQMKFNIAI